MVKCVLLDLLARGRTSATAGHGIGRRMKSNLPLSRSLDDIAVMQAIKRVVGPNGILNPGRIYDLSADKQITLIGSSASGALADGIARIVDRELSHALGKPVIVDNHPGGGGGTGVITVSKAVPDGLGATGAIEVNPHLPDSVPLNPDKQLEPLAKLANIPLVLVTGSKPDFGSLSVSDCRYFPQHQPDGDIKHAYAKQLFHNPQALARACRPDRAHRPRTGRRAR